MQWKSKRVIPKEGDTRVITKFILFPKLVIGETENTWVWLERIQIAQRYKGARRNPEDRGWYWKTTKEYL